MKRDIQEKDIEDDKIKKIKILQEKVFSLEKELNYLNKIIKLMPGNIYWKDRNGQYLGCNNGIVELSNFSSSKDIIGKTLYDIFDRDHAQEIDKADQKVMLTATTEILEEYGYDKNGQQAVYLTKKTPLINDKREVIGMLGMTFDISERKQQEKELQLALERAELAAKAKTDFMAIMSHELRNAIGNRG